VVKVVKVVKIEYLFFLNICLKEIFIITAIKTIKKERRRA